MKWTPAKAVILMVVLAVVAIALGALAQAAEVESIRDSQYEWECQDAQENTISGHTRQDKAFQSCYNQALATGSLFYVVGGRFRVTASGATSPPPEPPPDPTPEPDPGPNPETPQVTFGPVTAITQYPNTISALKQDAFRWEITFTLNSTAGIHGLASRDESGTTDEGHLSLWVESGVLTLRHQSGSPGAVDAKILGTTPIVAGTEYVATVSVDVAAGTGLFLDGALEGSDPQAWGTTGNDLPLTVGGLCTSCKDTTTPPTGPNRPADGVVYMEIWDDPLLLPTADASIELRWTNPTHNTDDTQLEPGELTAIRLYQTNPGARKQVAGVDPDQAAHEVTGLFAGVSYCFVATAVSINGASDDSNTACKVP